MLPALPLRRRRHLVLALCAGAVACGAGRPPGGDGPGTASPPTQAALRQFSAAADGEDAFSLRLLSRPLAITEQDWATLRSARTETDQARAALVAALRDDRALGGGPALEARLRLLRAAGLSRDSLRARLDRMARPPAMPPATEEWRKAMRDQATALAPLADYLEGRSWSPPQSPVHAGRRSTGTRPLPTLWDTQPARARGDGWPVSWPRLAGIALGLALVSTALALAARLWLRRHPGARGKARTEIALPATLTIGGTAPLLTQVINLSTGGAAVKCAGGTLAAGEAVSLDIAGVGSIGSLVVQQAGNVLRLQFTTPSPRQTEALERLTAAG